MKRVTVKLFIEDPVTRKVVPVMSEPDSAQVTAEGSVLVCESEYRTWRRVGSVAPSSLQSIMKGKARPV
jgi:hypothetical protein